MRIPSLNNQFFTDVGLPFKAENWWLVQTFRRAKWRGLRPCRKSLRSEVYLSHCLGRSWRCFTEMASCGDNSLVVLLYYCVYIYIIYEYNIYSRYVQWIKLAILDWNKMFFCPSISKSLQFFLRQRQQYKCHKGRFPIAMALLLWTPQLCCNWTQWFHQSRAEAYGLPPAYGCGREMAKPCRASNNRNQFPWHACWFFAPWNLVILTASNLKKAVCGTGGTACPDMNRRRCCTPSATCSLFVALCQACWQAERRSPERKRKEARLHMFWRVLWFV